MKKILSNLWLLILVVILIFIFFVKILWLPLIFLITLSVSVFIVLLLSKSKNPITLWITAFLIVWNILLLIFFMIPTYSWNVNLNGFYEKQKNYIKISIEDETNVLKENNVSIYVLNRWKPESRPLIHNLYDPRKDTLEIEIYPWDTISFRSKTKLINSVVNLYIWDGTIIRLFPQTTLSLNKLLKDQENITNSQTELNVEQWNIWFNVIKTIVNGEWFKIKTWNWTLVIRGTSWLVWYNTNDWETSSNTVVYSNDHLMELEHNNWQTYLISKWDQVQFNNENFININYEKFQRILWENVSQKIKQLPSIDEQDILEYKTNLKTHIIKNFWWNLEGKKYLESLWQYKLYFMSIVDKKYDTNLENYWKYKLLLWEQNKFTDKVKDYTQDMIFTPTNEQINKIKLKYIESKSFIDDQYFKSYIINSVNKILDAGKQIDIPKMQEYLPYIEKYKNVLKDYIWKLLQDYNINN